MSMESIAESAKRAIAGAKARRGDLCAFNTERSYTEARIMKRHTKEIWHLGEVAGVARDGVVLRIKMQDGVVRPKPENAKVLLVSKDRIEGDREAIVLAAKPEYETLEEVREYLRGFLKKS